MRWLIRMLIFWAITAPLFYFFGLPALLDMLSKKARSEGYTQCIAHLQKEGMMGSANAPVTAAQGETYCHCVSDRLTFTQNDVMDMVQKKPPAALTAMANALSQSCNRDLQQSMRGMPPAASPSAASDTNVITIE
jgi:hypothetical protein